MERENVLAFAIAVGADGSIEGLELAVAEVRRGGAQEWYRLAEVTTLARPTFDERDALATFSVRLAALQSPGVVRLVSVGGARRALPLMTGRAMAWRIPLPAVCDALAIPTRGFGGSTLCHVDMESELGPAGLRAAIPPGWRGQVAGQSPRGCAALSAFALYLRWQLARGAIGVRNFERSNRSTGELLRLRQKEDAEIARWVDAWDCAAYPCRPPRAASEGHAASSEGHEALQGGQSRGRQRRQWRLPGIADAASEA